MKAYWKNPAHRAAQAERSRKMFENPQTLKNLSEGCKRSWVNALRRRAAQSRRSRKFWREGRYKVNTNAAIWSDPVRRAEMSEKFKAAWVLRKARMEAEKCRLRG